MMCQLCTGTGIAGYMIVKTEMKTKIIAKLRTLVATWELITCDDDDDDD